MHSAERRDDESFLQLSAPARCALFNDVASLSILKETLVFCCGGRQGAFC